MINVQIVKINKKFCIKNRNVIQSNKIWKYDEIYWKKKWGINAKRKNINGLFTIKIITLNKQRILSYFLFIRQTEQFKLSSTKQQKKK